ncbi:MAG: TIGR01620 family protein, partial [Pseudomonadota bacterium]
MTMRGARAPEAFDLDDPHLEIEPEIVLDETIDAPPALIVPKRRTIPWGRLFWIGLGGLASLAIGLWADGLIRGLFARADALGWVGVGLAATVVLAVLAILGREVAGLLRLRRIHTLRDLATEAHATDAPGLGRRLGNKLLDLYADRPETAAGRNTLERELREIVDGRDIVALAEHEVLRPLDQAAQALVLASAKRVSV